MNDRAGEPTPASLRRHATHDAFRSGGYETQKFKESHIRDLTRYTVGPTLEFSRRRPSEVRIVDGFELFKPDDRRSPSAWVSPISAAQMVALWTDDLRSRGGKKHQYSYQDTEPYYLLTNCETARKPGPPGWFELYGGYDGQHMAYRWLLDADATSSEFDRVDRLTAANGVYGMRLGRLVHVKSAWKRRSGDRSQTRSRISSA